MALTAVYQEITRCRLCGNPNLRPILSLGEQALTGVFPKSSDEHVPRGPLDLVKCSSEEGCGLVQLKNSYDLSQLYGPGYGYRSALNSSMVAHLRDKVRQLVDRVGSLNSRDIVLDIGSNDGTLLGNYGEAPVRVGMDPTAQQFQEHYQPGIEIVTDFFSAEKFRGLFGDRKAKIVTSIAMFYDLEEPMRFVEEVASILANDGIWHFEQSYLPTMLETNAYDTICHEHLEYYSLKQIQWMMTRAGLEIIDVELNDINGGSFAVTVANKEGSCRSSPRVKQVLANESAARLDTSIPFERFRERVFEHREKLLAAMEKLRRQSLSTVGYGASTKGNVILQFCNIRSDQLPCIADVNPRKFGCFTPGTDIPIISETDAHAMKPDAFLVFPWHFRANLLQRERAFMSRGGRMLFPLPEIEIVRG